MAIAGEMPSMKSHSGFFNRPRNCLAYVERLSTYRLCLRDFIELLDLLYQNPSLEPVTLLQSDQFSYAQSEAVSDQADEGFMEFTI